MSVRRVQLRRGTSAENNAFTGAVGEITVDTTQNTIRVHDGVTAGGTETTLPDLSNIAPSATVDFNNQRIENVLDPVNDQDVATKAYVDSGGGIELGELINVTLNAPANGQIIVYDSDGGAEDNQWKNVTLSGDISIDNAGVASIGSEVIVNDDIANGTIQNVKLVNDSVTIGATEVVLGTTETSFSGLTGLDFTNADATIGASMTDDGAGTPTVLTLGGNGSRVKVANELLVVGDLTVQGTTTTVDSTNVAVADRVVELNKDLAVANANDLGLFLNRGTEDDALILWDEDLGGFLLATHSGLVDSSTLDYSSVVGLTRGDLYIGNLDVETNTTLGGTLGVTGVTTLTGLLNANGGIAVDTNAFTVADTTGNTNIQGTLDVVGKSTLASTSTIGDLEFTNGQIQTTAVDNNLSFNDNNLSTTGTLAVGSTTVQGNSFISVEKGATHSLLLNSDVVGDNTPANASIGVALSDGPSYATITWTQADTTWDVSHNMSVATDLTVGQDLIVTRNIVLTDSATQGITFQHDVVAGADETLLRVDRGATYSVLSWDESSAYFSVSHGLNVVGAISQGPVDGPENFSVSNAGVITTDSDGHRIAGLTFNGTTIEAFTNGAGIDFGDEDVSTTGDFSAANITSTSDMTINTATFSGLLTANGGITADGGVFTVADTTGNVATTGTLSVTGDVAINTNKFNITGATGAVSLDGTTGVITASAEGHLIADFSISDGSFTSATQIINMGTNDVTTTGDISATDITSTGDMTINTATATGLVQADGGLNVNDAFTVAANGDVVTSGTADLGATTVDSLNVSNANITSVGAIQLDTIQSAGDAVSFDILLDDNQATALEIKEGANVYQTFVTTDAGEKVVFGKLIEAPDSSVVANFTFSGSTISSSTDSMDIGNDALTTTGTGTFGSLDVSGGNIVDAGDVALDTISPAGASVVVDLPDNGGVAFSIVDDLGGANQTNYLQVTTTTGLEEVTLPQRTRVQGQFHADGGITVDAGVFTVDGTSGAIATTSTISARSNLTLDDTTNTTSPNFFIKEHTANVTTFEVLGETGNTSISGTLDVTGATTLNSTVTATGETTISGADLIVDDGNVTDVFSVANATGNTNVGGTLDVGGVTTLGANLDLDSNSIVNANDVAITTLSGVGSTYDLVLTDNQATALEIKEAGTAYQTFVTTDGGEKVTFGKLIEAPESSKLANLTFTNGVITSATGALSLGTDSLTTTGTADLGATTVDSLNVSNSNITNVADIALDTISANGGDVVKVDLVDNLALAFEIVDDLGGANETSYLQISSTTGAESVTLPQATIVDGSLTANAGVTASAIASLGNVVLDDTTNTTSPNLTINEHVGNTTTFQVLGASGNVSTEGTLSVASTSTFSGEVTVANVNLVVEDGANQENFKVLPSGNTTIAGTLDVTGAVTVSSGVDLNNSDLTEVNALKVTTIQSQAAATSFDIVLDDNQASALEIKEGVNVYQTFVTTDAGEKVVFGKLIEAPNSSKVAGITFSGDGFTSAGGTISLTSDDLTTTGSITVGDGNGGTSIDAQEGDIINVNDIALDTISSNNSTVQVLMDDNVAGAFELLEGANSYIKVDTTDGSEIITISTDVEFTGTASFTAGAIGLSGGNVVVNETGNPNYDFRVEGDTQTHLIFTDASADRVGINNATPSVQLDVVGDTLITGDTTLDGAVTLKGGAVVINEDAENFDLRVEGVSDTNVLVVDASADSVAIGKAVASAKLDVAGDVAISTTLDVTGKTTLVGSLDLTTASTDGITFRSEIIANDGDADQTLISVNKGDAGANQSTISWDASEGHFTITDGLNSEADFTVGANDGAKVFTIASASGNTELSGVLSVKSADLAGDANVQSAIVLLNSDATALGAERDARVEVERGTATNAYILWDESEDEWAISNALKSEGNFFVGADTFTVTASNGNTSVGGTLGVTGAITATAQNHTISDFTIADGSISSATATIDFNANNLTTTGSITCTNMTVNGTLTTINSTDLEITDAVIRLNKGVEGAANARDIGIIMERGTTGNDAIFFWDETDDIFKMGLTNVAADQTDFTDPVTWGDLKIGTLTTTSTITSTGVVNANGGIAIDTNGLTIDGATYKISSTGEVLVNKASTAAFLVQDGSANPIFNIDTTGSKVTITTALFEPDAGINVGADVFSVSNTGVTSILNTANVTITDANAFVVEDSGNTAVLNVDTAQYITSLEGQLKVNDVRPFTANSGDFKVRMTDNVANGLEIVGIGGTSYMTFTSTTGSEAITVNQDTTMNETLSVTGLVTLSDDLNIENSHTRGIFFNSNGSAIAGADATLITIEQGTTYASDVVLSWDISDKSLNLNNEASLHLQGRAGSNAFTVGGTTSSSANATLTTAGALTLASTMTAPTVTLDEMTDRTGDGMVFSMTAGQTAGLLIREDTTNYITLNTTAESITLHRPTTLGSTVAITGVTTLSDTLALTKSVADTGIVFNSNRQAADTPNGVDFDALLLHVENGGAVGAVDAYLKWDDSESSFVVEGGKLHASTAFSVGTNISTKNFNVTTAGVVTQSGSLTLDDIGNAVNPDFSIVNTAGTTTFEVLGATGNTSIEGTLAVTGISTFDQKINVLSGFSDSALVINSDLTGVGQEANANILMVERGTGTRARFNWDEADNTFEFYAGVTGGNGGIKLGVNTVYSDSGSLSFSDNDLTNSGSLSLTGTATLSVAGTTTLSDNVTIATTKSLTLNEGVANAAADVDATIFVDRGTDTDVFLRWDEGDDRWKITNDGVTAYNVLHENDALLSLTLAAYSGAATSSHTVRQNANTLTLQGTNEQVQVGYNAGVVTLSLPNTVTIPGDLNVTSITSLGSVLRIQDPLIFLGQSVAAQKDSGFYQQYRNDSLSIRFSGLVYRPTQSRWALFDDNSTLSSAGSDETIAAPDSELALLDVSSLRGGLATGTDTAGSDLAIIGGASTGAGAGGKILLQTTPTNISGSTANIPSTALEIDATQKATFKADVEIERDGIGFAVVTAKTSEGSRYEITEDTGASLSVTAPSSALTNKDAYFVDNSGTDFDVDLFALTSNNQDGYVLTIFNTDSTANATVNADGTETISGSASKVIAPNGSLSLMAKGNNWYVM
jgi:hypothetical protein